MGKMYIPPLAFALLVILLIIVVVSGNPAIKQTVIEVIKAIRGGA